MRSMLLALLLACLTGMSGCAAPTTAVRPEFKGVELYSWLDPATQGWRFALLPGTNRIKTAGEIRGSSDVAVSVDGLKRRISDLAPSESVFWAAPATGQFSLPPPAVVGDVIAYAASVGVNVHVADAVKPSVLPAGSIPVGETRHIVYLHGRIVQQQGKAAVSPEFGPYRFDDIVDELGRDGAQVHAPLRTGEPSIEDSAAHVETLVRGLLESGVPASSIVFVGASQGSIIAMLVSGTLANPQLRFVLMGGCNDWVRDELRPDLFGHILSIYEEGDPYGASCESVVAGKPGVTSFEELRLHTGLSHGFLYRPLPEWIDPTLRWTAQSM